MLAGAFVVAVAFSAVALVAAERVPDDEATSGAALVASDWPQFLGPERDGISRETGLIDAWPDGGPKELWRVAGGAGMSGLAIQGGQVVTLVQRDGEQRLIVLDAASGKELRAVAIAPAYENAMGDGPRATPALADGRAWAFSGEGVLVAVDLADGTIAWRHDVVTEQGGKPAAYGMASSPLLAGKLVVVTAGAPRGTLVAYDRATGDLAWTARADGGRETAGYSSAALLDAGGREQIVAFTGESAIGVAPQSGALLWRYPFVTEYDCNIATPLAYDGKVFISSGENHGAALLALAPKDDGFTVSEVWTSFGKTSVLRNEWQTSMLIDGHLYGFDNVGSAGPVTHLTCVDIATGKPRWQEARFGKGNLLAADGKLFITTFQGELVVVRATTERFVELGRKKLLRSTRQAPALAGGRLYLRDDREIVCVDVRR